MKEETTINESTEICPKCGSNWIGGNIAETFMQMRDAGNEYYKGKSDEEIRQMVKQSYSPPYKWGRRIGIEVREKYDGVSYWVCPNCNTTWDRFTGKETEEFKIEK